MNWRENLESKIIVLVTSSDTLYGINSRDGSIEWSLRMLNSFVNTINNIGGCCRTVNISPIILYPLLFELLR